MRPSEQFAVPSEAALIYDFLNTLDLRGFVQNGAPHQVSDQLASVEGLADWLAEHGLLTPHRSLTPTDHQAALALRAALRDYVALEPLQRRQAKTGHTLDLACAPFPIVMASEAGRLGLRPATDSGVGGLSRVIAQVYRLSEADKLDRLKTCDSEDCRWVFFDRSKPGNRRWCSSELCGNRHKTRDYRLRRRTQVGASF